MSGRVVGSITLAGALTVATYLWRQRQRDVVGYNQGEPFVLKAERIDGALIGANTAIAYRLMRTAAAKMGVALKVISAFRTMAEQEHLYACFRTGDCNSGNFAERPGFSAHQNGSALDLNSRTAGVEAWLREYAWEFNFHNTVPSEPWHWEHI